MALSRGLLKLLLVGFCALFLIAGLAIIAIAIWTLIEKIYLSHIIGTTNFTVAAIFLFIGGVVIIATAGFGLVAVMNHRKLFLLIFFILLLVIFIILLIGAVMAVVFQGELENKMKSSMRDTLLENYGKTDSTSVKVTNAWDKVQKDLQCCAVENQNWRMYNKTTFFTEQSYKVTANRQFVPVTCCVYDERIRDYVDKKKCQNFPMGPPNNPTTHLRNEFLNYDGCYVRAKDFLTEHAVIIIAIGFVFAFGLIVGVVLSFFYYRRVSYDEAMERKHGYTERDAQYDEEENRRL